VPALVLTAPYCAVQFTVLQQSKAFVRSRGLDQPKWASVASFISGATAGAAATLASYPFDLLRTVLASQGNPPIYRNMFDATAGLFQQRGVSGLFKGVGITLVEIIPYAGIQFGTYDTLTAVSNQWLEGVELSPRAAVGRTFIIGLLSGFVGKVRAARALHSELPSPRACGKDAPFSLVEGLPQQTVLTNQRLLGCVDKTRP
jgi:solute carrier family 25 (mitochondrial thiamine pyrophosphate transporter), member 19